MNMIEKTRKFRRMIDWIGVAISIGLIFYVTSPVTKIILAVFTVASIAFIIFNLDKRIEQMILRRFAAKTSKSS